MIFPILEADETVQVNDKFRLSAVRSYVSKDEAAITLVEIQPESGGDFIDVTGSGSSDWYLDWQYASAAAKTATLRVTTDGDPTSTTLAITAVTSATDALFSDDDDLKKIESDIMKYLPDGRASWKYMHRAAQEQILEWLFVNGYRKSEGERIEKTHFTDVSQVKYWSAHLTASLIYWDLKKIEGDVWEQKARAAEAAASKYQRTVSLKFDYDGDGELEALEELNMWSREMVRR